MSAPFSLPLRVYYEDTDCSGVVYHANYLKYFERARTEWVRAQGLVQERLRQEHGLAFTVVSLSVDFVKPARLDDRLEATVTVAQRLRASLRFDQELRRAPGGELLARAQARVACVDVNNFRPRPLPRELGESA